MFSPLSASDRLKFLRQALTEAFWQISRLRSRKRSSRRVSASQHRHRVSLVRTPYEVKIETTKWRHV